MLFDIMKCLYDAPNLELLKNLAILALIFLGGYIAMFI
jgi:hypothetical protein